MNPSIVKTWHIVSVLLGICGITLGVCLAVIQNHDGVADLTLVKPGGIDTPEQGDLTGSISAIAIKP
ncbi:MAG: hypothetical protein ACFBSC_07105 [Microcoleaceae cyanobacterium]